jgi:hypothetical protein
MVLIIGQEIAEAITPFVKWGAVVAGVLLFFVMIRGWIRRGAKKEERLEATTKGQKAERDAREGVRERAKAMRDRWRARRRRRRLPDD